MGQAGAPTPSRWRQLLKRSSAENPPQESISMTEAAKAKIDASAEDLYSLSQNISPQPSKVTFAEHHPYDIITDFLEEEEFNIEHSFVLDKAFRATFGCDDAGPNVCVICEFDPQRGIDTIDRACGNYCDDVLPGFGHACGQNLIAECGVAAGLAIKAALEANGNKYGKVTVLGTPAQDGGDVETLFMQPNAFDDITVVMMAHPSRYNISRKTFLAKTELKIKFHGKASHAAASPWDGNNALDAAVMCYQAISNMRQQIKPDCRIHGVFTNGGAAPNILPEESELMYYLQAPDEDKLSVVKRKVLACAEGAAQAAECKVETKFGVSYANVVTNDSFVSIYEKHIQESGVELTEDNTSIGSSHFGNVSHIVPCILPMFSVTESADAYTPEFAVAAGGPEAQAPTLIQAKALALTAIELLQPDGKDKLMKIQQEFKESTCISRPTVPEVICIDVE
ncbi:peptidase M20 domain-containing protein 2-like [Asterias rubens]|uniref:peptidase M20 domain-containing protein 2-like n=1 Tax=Asterias rubens TaxID=7604 RepID=UPI001455B866|nr:peptidase M20 domain-containing protein 2-like [Asterias rubens]